MSKLLKKSLALVLALALCLTAFVGCFSVSAEVASANYSLDFGTVTNGLVTATLKVASTKEDLAALLFTLDMPGVPVTAISTDSVFTVDTNPDYEGNLPLNGVKQLRVLVNSKTTGKSYNYANVNITFDVSSKALVSSGFDPDVSNKLDLVVTSMQAATYSGGYEGFEGNVWIIVNESATVNGGGQASASVSVKGTCTHNYVSSIHTPATCNNAGIKRFTCSHCGKYYDETIEQLVHNWNDGVITTPAGCVQAGVKTFTCSLCGGTRTEPVDAVGSHDYYTGSYDGNSDHFDIHEGTCGTDGYAYPKCSRCGAINSSVSINLGTNENNHNVSSWEQTKDPTCGEAGEETGTCDDCFAEATRPVAPTGKHSWNDGVITSPGVKTFTCTVCGATKTEETDECSHATHKEAAYEANSNGTYDAVVRCADCNELISSTTTDIPATTTVNTAIAPGRYAYVDDTLGVFYSLKKSQVKSYKSYTIKVYRQSCNADYNFITTFDGEITDKKEASSRVSYYFKGLALYEFNLPVTAVVYGYDANGNLAAVSAPMVDYPVDLIWATYTPDTATQVYKTCCLDLVNLASEAQLYFAGQKDGCDLSKVTLPRDKFAFDQNDASKSAPSYDLNSMPNSTVNNPSSSIATTNTLTKTISLASGAPALYYMVKRGKDLDASKFKAVITYTPGVKADTTATPITVTVNGSTATDTTVPWSYSGARATYTYDVCKLYDTNKTVTAVYSYDGVEMYTDTYSIETFIAQYMTDAAMGATLTAMAKFGVSARAYFEVN